MVMNPLESSILNTIKPLLGPTEEYTAFDLDIIIHINAALAVLTQIGVGDPAGFYITGESEKWSDFIKTNDKLLGFVQTYVYLKTKLVFDPPANASLIEAIKSQINEYEWRINDIVDYQTP